jgi:hypothetical protein
MHLKMKEFVIVSFEMSLCFVAFNIMFSCMGDSLAHNVQFSIYEMIIAVKKFANFRHGEYLDCIVSIATGRLVRMISWFQQH